MQESTTVMYYLMPLDGFYWVGDALVFLKRSQIQTINKIIWINENDLVVVGMSTCISSLLIVLIFLLFKTIEYDYSLCFQIYSRFVFLLQASSQFMDTTSSSKINLASSVTRPKSRTVGTTMSVGLVVKKFWSRVVQTSHNIQQLKHEVREKSIWPSFLKEQPL